MRQSLGRGSARPRNTAWSRGTRIVRAATVAATCVLAATFAPPAHAAADPIIANRSLLIRAVASNGSHVVRGVINDQRHISILVHSVSMNADIPVQIQRPADTSRPRPILYLLNGAGGGEDAATWAHETDILPFLEAMNVNIVSPIGGKFSYYADWQRPDAELGVNKWQTFLTQELPPLLNAGLGSNGVNAIAGLSSSATSVLSLAESAPKLYRGVASYSGCAQISDPIGRQFVAIVVARGGGNPANMYGPQGDPAWVANDPVVNAEKLRGMQLYISTGNGMPGPHDNIDDPHLQSPGPLGLANQILIGGGIEAATNYCTHNLADRLGALGIPATFSFRDTGTHSWGYWEDEFKASWPVLRNSLGI